MADMEDLAPQLSSILVGDTSGDESNPQGALYPNSIGVPVTLVVSGGLTDQTDMEAQSNAMLTTLALQTDDGCGPATQFFLEQLADGQTRLKTADGQMLDVDIDPATVGLVQGNSSVPVLLQVSPDGTLLQRDDVQIALAESGAVADSSDGIPEEQAEEAEGSTMQDDSSEPIFQDGENLPLQMYLQVGKDMPDENSTSLEDVGQADTGTAVAIVTPDGDESDADDPPMPTVVRRVERVERLEDFMDVVTTYRCKFCRFSCAWRSGLMSHFRSCHVAPSTNGSPAPLEPPPSNANRPLAPKVASAASNAVAFALTTSGPGLDVGSTGAGPSIEVDSPSPALVAGTAEPSCSEPAAVASVSQAAEPTHVPMDASMVLESALASMVSPGDVLPSGTPLQLRGEEGELTQERHIFICGQCSQGFGSLDDCKDHMVKIHGLKLGPNATIEPKKVAAIRKRGRPRCTPQLFDSTASSESDVIAGALQAVDVDLDDGSNEEASPNKRRVRPPKNLEEDYLVAPARRRRMKKENTNERHYRCGERCCGYRFSTESSLEYHVRCHTPTASRPYTCPECGDQRDHWRSLAMHLWRSHLLDLDLHRCSQCNYRTFSTFKLENHARIHSDERDFTCAQCGKGFKQLSQLRNHHVVHLDRKNTPHKRWYSQQTCELCQRTFSDSKCLRKHHQAVHGKVKPYVCTFCGHMSARKAMLQLHLRQHTGEKPFACNLCEYRTGDHNSLRRHKMRHSGTKPYKCPHCPYACIQAISYKMHMKNKHPGLEGLYACTVCNFRSVSKENYTNHMSDHKRGILAPSAPPGDDASAEATSAAATEGEALQLPEGSTLLSVCGSPHVCLIVRSPLNRGVARFC